MSKRICKTCQYWTRSNISDGLIEIDEIGDCVGLTSGPYDVQIMVDEDWLEDKTVLTDYDFYCKNYQKQE